MKNKKYKMNHTGREEAAETAAHERAETPEFEAKEHGVPASQGAALRSREIREKTEKENAGRKFKYQMNRRPAERK